MPFPDRLTPTPLSARHPWRGSFAALLIGMWAGLAAADQERMPAPRVFAASDGAVAFAMLPPALDARTQRVVREGRGVLYDLRADGSWRARYRTQGWYASELFVSADGRTLVRLGPWQRGKAIAPDHLALAFHRDGKLLRQYRVAELVKDPTAVRATVSHYFWRLDEVSGEEGGVDAPRLSDVDGTFTLKTIDGIEYVFGLEDGAIRRTDPPVIVRR